MPTCVAEGCGARSDRGELLKIFPRKDLLRRQIWIDRVNRPGWHPTKHSALCELHFDRDQWELPREDGKRKLKNTAVPTIFCVDHPKNDVAVQDHAYCIRGYRQLFGTKDTQENAEGDEVMPIENIKLEVGENENFSLESVKEREVEEYDYVREEHEQVENIQCTPDITVYPERGEPDPIEMVACEEDEINASMYEPSNDPLAISADDMVRAESAVPYFGQSKKIQFITKDTRYVVTGPSRVRGEPVAATKLPNLKVTSLQRLLKPHSVLLESSPKLKKMVVPTSVPSSNTQIRLVPQQTLLKPNLTEFSPVQNLHTISSSDTSPAKIKLTSQNYTPHQNSNLHSSPLMLNVTNPNQQGPTLPGISGVSQIKTAISTLQPAPEFLRPLKRNSPTYEQQFIKLSSSKPNFQSRKHMILVNTALKNNGFIIRPPNQDSFLNNHSKAVDSSEKCKVIVNSMKNCALLENIYLEHDYVNKPLWRPVTLNGIKLKKEVGLPGRKCYRMIGNNDVKMWINNGSQFRKIYPKYTNIARNIETPNMNVVPTIQSSSVIVLNPFDKSQPSQFHLGTNHFLPSVNKPKVDFYQCSICKFSFLTLASLRLHVATHIKSKSNAKLCIRTDANVQVDDIAKPFVLNLDGKKGRSVASKPPEIDESKVKEEPDGDVVELANRKTRKTRGRGIRTPQQFQNGLVCIPNLNVLKNLKRRFEKESNQFPDTEDPGLKVKVNKALQKTNAAKKMKLKNVLLRIPKLDEIAKPNLEIVIPVENESLKKVDICSRETGRRYHLRAKSKLFKSKQIPTGKCKPKRTNKQLAVILNKTPIVLLPKFDNKAISDNKTTDKSSESANTDNNNVGGVTPEKVLEPSKKEKKVLKDNTQEKSIELYSEPNDKKYPNSTKMRCSARGFKVQKSLLKNHMMLHAISGYTCGLCHKKFTKSYQLRQHVSYDHKVEKSFMCSLRYCCRTFESKRLLNKHMRTHKK